MCCNVGSICGTTLAAQWKTCVQCARHICLGTSANNVKCMYTSAHGYTVDCSEFICGMYSDVVISYMHMNLFVYVTYMWI